MILELKDKLSFEELEEDGVGAEIFDTSADSSDSVMITIEGLVSLGYSKVKRRSQLTRWKMRKISPQKNFLKSIEEYYDIDRG